MGQDGTIKGVALRELLSWYTEGSSREALTALHQSLSEEARGLFDPGVPGFGILPASWYPAPPVHELLDAIVRDLDASERHRFVRDAGAAVIGRTLRGIYGTLFRAMATPARYAKYSPRLWHSYYKSGDFTVRIEKDGHAICEISNWDDHHPLVCDLNYRASGLIFEAMGCQDVTSERSHCVAMGDGLCRFSIRWRTRGGH